MNGALRVLEGVTTFRLMTGVLLRCNEGDERMDEGGVHGGVGGMFFVSVVVVGMRPKGSLLICCWVREC